MAYLILNITEFSYLVSSGELFFHSSRIYNCNDNGIDTYLFKNAGYIKYASPESYLICKLDDRFVKSNDKLPSAKIWQIQLDEILEIIPLTENARVLLQPLILRARLIVSPPNLEKIWEQFVDEEILSERLNAAKKFARLFSYELFTTTNWIPAANLYKFMLKDLGASAHSDIEKRIESAELGVFEFCVRLALCNTPEWRNTNEMYLNLKKIRTDELGEKKSTDYHFLNSPKLCVALHEFHEISVNFFGYSPICLSLFFEFYRRYSESNGIEFNTIYSNIVLLLKYGLNDDAINYVHLVGYAIGIDGVAPATYFIDTERFKLFDHKNTRYPSLSDISIRTPEKTLDPFEVITEKNIENNDVKISTIENNEEIISTDLKSTQQFKDIQNNKDDTKSIEDDDIDQKLDLKILNDKNELHKEILSTSILHFDYNNSNEYENFELKKNSESTQQLLDTHKNINDTKTIEDDSLDQKFDLKNIYEKNGSHNEIHGTNIAKTKKNSTLECENSELKNTIDVVELNIKSSQEKIDMNANNFHAEQLTLNVDEDKILLSNQSDELENKDTNIKKISKRKK